MDKIWIYLFTLESNQQSTEWIIAGETHPKQPKTLTSAGKVFLDVQGSLITLRKEEPSIANII